MVKSQVEFPSLDKKVKLKNSKSKTRMPKFTRKKRQIKRATCDGDLMTTEKFDRVMAYHGAKIDEQNSCEQSDDCACCKKPDILPDDDEDDDFMCGVCEEEDSQETPQNPTFEQYMRDGIHPDQLELWDKFQKEYFALKKTRESISKLPGCSSGCTHGQHCLRTCRAATYVKPAYEDVSRHIAFSSQDKMSLNILTFASGNESSVLNVEDKMVWVQIPCAVDSGACAHVVPPNVFGVLQIKQPQQKGKYFGADGSPIDEFGQLTINAVLDGGTEMKTTFDVASITRPLLSVNQILENGHQVIFGKNESYIKPKGSNKRIPLRAEGRLYMLDMWVKIPASVAEKSPFVRQVSQA